MAGEGEIAGFARLGVRSAAGGGAGKRRAWWWTAVVGKGRTLVMVRDHDVDPPKPGTLEVRASGLWAEPVCETPHEHWSLGLEALAVALDDPTDAYGGERGDPVPLGLDLEWEAVAPAEECPAAAEAAAKSAEAPAAAPVGQYRQACAVHGQVLVGRERLAVAGVGAREHSWGPRDWWGGIATWAAGALEDGTPVGTGPEVEAAVDLDGRSLMRGGRLRGPGILEATLQPVLHAPLQVPAVDGRVSRLARALCRVDAVDGRRGWAWAERLQPA